MLTKEVRQWLEKVQRRQYSYEDAMYEFLRFSSFLTREEMKMLKTKIEESYNS
jgi:disulfide oxidoreductase YuzD